MKVEEALREARAIVEEFDASLKKYGETNARTRLTATIQVALLTADNGGRKAERAAALETIEGLKIVNPNPLHDAINGELERAIRCIQMRPFKR